MYSTEWAETEKAKTSVRRANAEAEGATTANADICAGIDGTD